MKNFIQTGSHMTFTADADLTGGQGKIVGALFGVVQGDAVTGEPYTLVTEGVFELPKTEAQNWTVGVKVYWDDTNSRMTTAASGNTLVGVAAAAAANPSTAGLVRLGLVA